MIKRFIVGAALAMSLAGLGLVQASGPTGTITDAVLDMEAEAYDARLDTLHIGAQPQYMYAGKPLPVLYDGQVDIMQRATDEFGMFVQCHQSSQGEECIAWVYWLQGPSYHVFLPIVAR